MSVNSTSITSGIGLRLVSMTRWNKIAVMVAADLIFLPVCFIVAMLLRIGDPVIVARYGIAPYVMVAVITVPVFAMAGLYGAVIRYIDQRLLTASGIALGMVIALTYGLSAAFNYKGLPRNALMIYWFIAFSYVVASRLSARALIRFASHRRERACPVAIYGAGEAGAQLAVAMRLSDRYRAVCFFDDDPSLTHRNIAGLKVFHTDAIGKVARDRGAAQIVIAVPSATPAQRREMMLKAQQAGLPVKTLNGLMEIADEKISTRSIRDIKIDDLLGREPIKPHYELFSRCVHQKNVLVTGAGGSIGSELCRQIASLRPKKLHLLDHAEHALYSIEQELLTNFPGTPLQVHLGSVCDEALVTRVMASGCIDTVYHAAAYKHVPMVEQNMAEGIRNNVLGAKVVAHAAGRSGVGTCVLVSTDKAVRPTSMMGASKRIAELVFQAAALRFRGGTRFCMVRFGNVLGSSGSVVPLFRQQIERGGPITITHRDVVRYFMSIPEAAQLVMQAGAMARGGDVFVMDMGAPVRIVDLARTMIAMCGLKEKSAANPDGDIEIRFIGLRPGEKLYEELFAGNDAIPSKHPRIMTTTEYVIEPDALDQQISYLMVACATNDKAMMQHLVQRLVKGYAPYRPADAVAVAERAADAMLSLPGRRSLQPGG